MPRPKKPPRQKKASPAPARRTSAEGSESPTSEPSLQTPDTPPPNLPPKPTSPKVSPKPSSVRNAQKVISSAMSNSTDENHVLDSSSVVTEQLHSSQTETDQSKSLLQRSKNDQSGAITTDINQPQPTYSEIDQSDKQSVNDQSNRSSYGFQLSPTPELPPKPCAPNSIDTIDPVFGTPVKQNVYMEMKPIETKQPETQITELKPGDVNVDNYDILFPKFKNTKGNSLQQSSSKTKKPEFRRTNTAPDENIYVGPSSPESTLAKFKEKQGLLRRANTSPDENMYITVTEKILKRQDKVEIENEYSEISEQKSPQSPQSPSENVYEVIPEKRDSNVYAEVKDAHSGTKGRDSDVSDRAKSEAVSESSALDGSQLKETNETENSKYLLQCTVVSVLVLKFSLSFPWEKYLNTNGKKSFSTFIFDNYDKHTLCNKAIKLAKSSGNRYSKHDNSLLSPIALRRANIYCWLSQGGSSVLVLW